MKINNVEFKAKSSRRKRGLKVLLPWPGLYAVPPHLVNRLKLYGVIE